jgi:hypothetical protein
MTLPPSFQPKHLLPLIPVVVVLCVIAIIALVSLTGGDDDDDNRVSDRPTVPSFPTAGPTTTANATELAQASTSTPLPTSAAPTPTRFRGFPTLPVAQPPPAQLPRAVQIVSPVSGQTLSSTVTVWGSASDPNFAQYTLEWGPDPNPANLWYPITPSAVTQAVQNSVLGAWDTTLVADGTYQIRIHLYLTNVVEQTNVGVRNLIVNNQVEPEPDPVNNPPVINPIAAVEMERGTTTTIALGISDPDGDTTEFIATSDNTQVASVTPSGQAITLLANQVGVATIRVRVIDGRGARSEDSFLVTVVEPPEQNNPPNVAPIPSQTLTQGTTLAVPVTISDPDGDAIQGFAATSASPNIVQVTTSPTTNRINLTGLSAGTTTVTVRATDVNGAESQPMNFSVVVNPPEPDNNPPSIGTISGQSLLEGDSVELDLSISDPDAGDTLTTSVNVNNPSFASVEKLSEERIRINGLQEGTTNVTVTVRDNENAASSTVFSVNVSAPPPPNQPPSIGSIPAQTVEEGDTISIDLALSDPDPNDVLTFSATSNAANVATAGQVDDDTMSVRGVSVGSAQITVTVGDGNGGSAQTTFSVTVEPAPVPNQQPTIDAIPAQTVEVGRTLEVSFSYGDPDGDTLTIFASAGAPDVATVFQSGVNTLTVSGVSVGNTQMTVEVDDGRGGTATRTFPVTVAPANQNPTIASIPEQTCLQGAQLPVSITVSDPDGDPITNVNASSQNPNLVAVASADTSTVNLTCASPGTATIVVEVTDNRDGIASTSFSVVVNTPNQDPVIDPLQPISAEIGATPQTVALNYSDPDGDPLTVEATSSNPNVAAVSLNPEQTQLTVSFGNTAGESTVAVTVSDDENATATATFTVTLTQPANQPPTLAPIGPVTVEVGQNTTTTYTAADPEGGPITLQISAAPQGIATVTDLGNGQLQVTGVAAGQTTVTVVATDNAGATSAQQAFQVTVTEPAPQNQPPTLAPIGPVTVEAGQNTTTTYTAADPEGGPITLQISAAPQGIATVTDLGNGQLQVTGVAAGQTTVTVVATDNAGATSAQQAFQVTVTEPAAPPPAPNLPGVPDIAALAPSLQPYYGGPNVNRQAFSLAGDDTLTNANFVDAIVSGNYNLGNYASLQTAIDSYNFSYQSLATGVEWTPQMLLDPAQADPALCQPRETPLACELRTNNPAVIFITFSSANATKLDVPTFTTAIQTIVQESLNAGAIPIIALLPNDGIVTDQALLDQYNTAIVQATTGAAGDPNLSLPVWDIPATMQGVPQGVYTTSPNGAGDYTDGGLQYGGNRRGLGALQILEGFRAAFP